VELAVRNVVHGLPVTNTDALGESGALEHFRNRPEPASLERSGDRCACLPLRLHAGCRGLRGEPGQRISPSPISNACAPISCGPRGVAGCAADAALLEHSRTRAAVRGIYLWGSVVAARPCRWICSRPPFKAKRQPFRLFMQVRHEGLGRHRNEVEPLVVVAADIAAERGRSASMNCSSPTSPDAMLLGGLVQRFVDRGVMLVFTSNASGLDRNAERQRFLPAIALLERHCDLVCVDGAP
jgi:hypothetical protein